MPNASQTIDDFRGDNLSVKMFGAKGDGVTDDTAAIQSAIDAITASAQSGANVNGEMGTTLSFPPGKYLVSAGLKFTHNGVILKGSGAAQIVAAASYSGTGPVIRMNPLDTIESSDQLRGCSICDLQVNVGANPSISPVIEMRSVSNSPIFRNLTVSGHTGTALRIGGESGAVQKVSEGLEFHNFYAWGGYQSGSGDATDDAVVIDETNEVTFYGGKVMYASAQGGNTYSGVKLQEATQAGHGIHFYGLSVDKYNRSVSVVGTSTAPPWWVDFKGCTFEAFNHALHIVGTAAQYIRFISADESNRYVSSQGSSPRKVYAEYVTASSFAFTDSYDPNPSYTAGDPVIEMGAHSTLNYLLGPANLVTGLGTNGSMSVDPSTGCLSFAGQALTRDTTSANFRAVNTGGTGSAVNLSAQALWALLMTTTSHPLLLGANNQGHITCDPAALTTYIENVKFAIRNGSYADICNIDPSAGVELYRPSGTWSLTRMKAAGSSSGDSVKFADTQIGGQTYGLAYLEWVRDSGQGRKFRIVVCDNSSVQHTFEIAMNGAITMDGSPLPVTLPNVGTAGTYQVVTTDAQGRVTAGSNPTSIGLGGATSPRTELEIWMSAQSSPMVAGTPSGGFSLLSATGLYGLWMGVLGSGKTYIQSARGDSATYYNLLLQPSGGGVEVGSLAGTGTRMVTADATGTLGTSAVPASSVTSQSVVTGSRALGTVYQNTGSTAKFVSVTVRCTAAGGANFGQSSTYTDASNPPTTAVASTFNGNTTATQEQTMSFWVLPGNYYKVAVVTTTVTLSLWTEWS